MMPATKPKVMPSVAAPIKGRSRKNPITAPMGSASPEIKAYQKAVFRFPVA